MRISPALALAVTNALNVRMMKAEGALLAPAAPAAPQCGAGHTPCAGECPQSEALASGSGRDW